MKKSRTIQLTKKAYDLFYDLEYPYAIKFENLTIACTQEALIKNLASKYGVNEIQRMYVPLHK